ncbi:MAG: hypothetical protein MUF44_01855 [Hydrogenophaga sp.]|jgi:hypothetical protein|nr:hypothetical protein [Hydrogenophaga sp.]
MPFPLIAVVVAVVRVAAPIVIRVAIQAAKQAPKVGKGVVKQAPQATKQAVKKNGPKKGNTPVNKYKDKAKKKEKKPKGPCDHLKKGNGKGDYRGGAHSETTKPRRDGKDSHHMPTDKASPLVKKDGPAIQMNPKDHGKTSSNGQSAGYADYIADIAGLLNEGKWRDAMAVEVKDVRRVAREIGDPKKYNEAIKEALAYFKCLEKHGILNKKG